MTGRAGTRVAWIAVAVAVAAFLLVQVLPLVRDFDPQLYDYRYYSGCHATFFSEERPYDGEKFRRECFYPPASYYALQTFFREPSDTRALAWRALVLAATAAAFLLPLAFLPPPVPGRWGRRAIVLVGWAAVVFSQPYDMAASSANVATLITTLLFASVLALARGPAWLRFPAGVAIGAAAVVKVFPLYVALWLLATGLWRRDGRSRDAGLVACAVFAASQLAPHFTEFWSYLLAPAGFSSGVALRAGNAGLVAFLWRAGLHVSPALVLFALGLPLAALSLRRRSGLVAEFNLVMVLATMSSPAVWAQSLTVLAILLVLAADATLAGFSLDALRDPRRRGPLLLRLLGLAFCVLVFVQPSDFVFDRDAVSLVGGAMAGMMPVVLTTVAWAFPPWGRPVEP
jgi:hypothetical protein